MVKVRIFYDEKDRITDVFLKNIDLDEVEVYYEDDEDGDYARKRKSCRLANWEEFN